MPAALAVIGGVDSFEAIALFGQLDEAGLLTFPELLHGISSHDTLERVCARRDAARMEKGFRDGVQDTLVRTAGQVVVIASGTL